MGKDNHVVVAVVVRTITARAQLKKKKISGRESQGSSRQDELMGGKPPIVK
jgi:hypothetical protein